MYEVTVVETFSAAHRLKDYKGKCEELHGHNWKVELKLTGKKLDKTGMLYDFTELKKILKKIVSKLDHKYLNEITFFDRTNPTSENIAKYIHNQIRSLIPSSQFKISKVTVWESENSSASYT